jgi:hypothetical protein
MGLHHLAGGFVKNQIGKIELHDTVQPRRKIMKELVEVPVRGDRLRNLEKSLVLAV